MSRNKAPAFGRSVFHPPPVSPYYRITTVYVQRALHIRFIFIFFIFLQESLLNINDERKWGEEAMMLSRPSRSRLPCGHEASKYKQKYCVKYDYEEIKEGK